MDRSDKFFFNWTNDEGEVPHRKIHELVTEEELTAYLDEG